ncbi:hypothetical protein NEMIN01_0498 [Nematocida minor]|uniref:uncharacterized protein n=1 Tax=Nematocida minor TaxID=1912983 RepID=UPI0022209F9E|nr:uncharacterized protein NEMIN01_0498 [Nematocida minor]KAI5189435.1 hypothetical protein NEMIN01_0498 [Nematocida minor]
MKQKIFIIGAIIALTHAYVNATDGEDDIPLYANASDPMTAIDLNDNPSKKKKIVRVGDKGGLGYLFHQIGGYLKSSLLSALKPVSTKLSDFDMSDPSEDHQSDLFPSEHQINKLQSPLQTHFNLSQPSSSQNAQPYHKVLSIDSVRPSFIPYAGGVAEITIESPKKREPQSDLEKGFYKKFDQHHRKVHNTKEFIRKGIQNAKKNLLLQTKLARAYAAEAANKTMGVFEDTLRSSHLLSNLVKKGLVTPYSAARELANSVKDVASEYIDASSRNMKGASNYLLKTAVESVDGIVNGLKDSPSAAEDLLPSYKGVLNDPKYNFHKDLPYLASSMEMDMNRLKEYIHPHKKKAMGTLWQEMAGTIEVLKEQWNKLGNSLFNKQTIIYKKKFLSLTEDLAKILDALQSYLGKSARLEVPGIDALRDRFKSILDEIKKKNHLAISGDFSFKELLDYSLGVFTQLKDIDRAVLGIDSNFNRGFGKMASSNPLSPLSGYNQVGLDALEETRAYSGVRHHPVDAACIGNCFK